VTMRDFIKENREEIDQSIKRVSGVSGLRLNDKDRQEWIANDEGLYNWAMFEGVNV